LIEYGDGRMASRRTNRRMNVRPACVFLQQCAIYELQYIHPYSPHNRGSTSNQRRTSKNTTNEKEKKI